MILYVNGDSHAAGAEAAVPFGWAQDDELFWSLGKRPHPDNERASFGCELANHLHAIMDCDAQSGASNDRIMRTTRDWVQRLGSDRDVLIMIQWSTWERQEWLVDNEYYQVGASGADSVPDSQQERYRRFIADIDWQVCTEKWHDAIWLLHQDLLSEDIPHVFFNGNSHFGDIQDRRDWQGHFMSPYDAGQTYDQVLRSAGFETVRAQSWHFGADAHCFWAQHVLNYVHHNNII